jgi:hypothetical protein
MSGYPTNQDLSFGRRQDLRPCDSLREIPTSLSNGGILETIRRFFLRAKHWQVFVLVWGAYFVGQMAMVAVIPEGPVIDHPLRVGLFAEAVMSPFLLFFMGWLWSLGSFLFSTSGSSLRPSIRAFRFAVIFSTLYLFAALPFFLSSGSTATETVILPLHLLALACLTYVFYFDARSLAIAEKGEEATSNDHVLPFFLLFFSLIGIWLIQPRINRLYAHKHA